MVRVAILVVFYNEDTHGRQGFWNETFTTKLEIGSLVTLLEDVELLQPSFLLVVCVQPNLLVGIAWVKSCF